MGFEPTNTEFRSDAKADWVISTLTLVGEEDNGTIYSSWQLGSSEKKKEKIALKLNRLKDKVAKYKSHKDFLSQCITEELLSQRVWNLNWNPQSAVTTKNLLAHGTQS